MSRAQFERRDAPWSGEDEGPIPRARESFTACMKRRIQFTAEDRNRYPALTYMEKMADRMIDTATTECRAAMNAAKTIASYTDGKPAMTINNIFRGSERTIDPDRQKMLMDDPIYREHILALEERQSQIDSGDADEGIIDAEFAEMEDDDG